MTTYTHSRRYPGSDPRRRMVGWIAVVAFHLFVGWALVTGTARKGLEMIKKPMEAAVIQEVIIPPPPPPPPPPKKIETPKPEPRVEAPPPPFVPPPEVTPPSTSAPAIQSVQTPPPAPPVIAPPPPPAAPPAPPARPARVEMSVVCPTQTRPEMPRQAVREGAQGVVVAQATIKGGSVTEVQILSGPRVFHSAVRNAMLQYKCNAEGAAEITATQEFVFKLE
ncbi:energy transducer TonB [Ramlibacter sp.]|uniref:energy transducer TonB n=1 Tax=Ramlibacter sp. TaxID=1917967 RepID=UPI0035B3242A